MDGVMVGRHINGITLNDLEWLLNDAGEQMVFDSESDAKTFLANNGFTDEDMQFFVFKPVAVKNNQITLL